MRILIPKKKLFKTFDKMLIRKLLNPSTISAEENQAIREYLRNKGYRKIIEKIDNIFFDNLKK